MNVHRSLALYTSDGDHVIEGPFLVDVDNSAEDVDDALDVARRTVGILGEGMGIADTWIRVCFSGRKGFHVEVAPAVVAGRDWNAMLDELRQRVREESAGPVPDGYVTCAKTVIDPMHEFVRFGNSLNAWLDDAGEVIARRQVQLTREQLEQASAQEILRLAQLST